MSAPTILAYYLPQFHEITENNEWWGKGFTEWTALRGSRKYHSFQEIRKPVEPFFEYSLPSREVMEWQDSIAKEHHIDGFLLWDYWFGDGKTLLTKPKEFIKDNDLKFSYALIWANHSWYNKSINKLLIEQKYLGEEDYTNYFLDCLNHFKKDEYVKIQNKPVFGIYMPFAVPDLSVFIDVFTSGAKSNGFDGIHWVVDNTPATIENKKTFNSVISSTAYFKARKSAHPINFFKEQLIKRLNFNSLGPVVYSYKKLVSNHEDFSAHESPAIFTGWDTTPRHGKRGTILKDFSVENFQQHLRNIFAHASTNGCELLVLKSWNEWAEGNTFEPDSIYGYRLLDTFRNSYSKYFMKGKAV